MKTMKQGANYIRVKESEVNSRLNQGYQFCPKSEWKKNVRDAGVVEKSDVQTDENKPKTNVKGKAKKSK